MKSLFATLALFSTTGILMAGELPQTIYKIRFVHTGADNQRTEVEAQSMAEWGNFSVPLLLPAKSIWICSVSLDVDNKVTIFTVKTPNPAAGESSKSEPEPLLNIIQVMMPLRNGEEMVLVKSNSFTLSATLTMTAENSAVKAGNPAAETAAKALTDGELAQIPIKTFRQSSLLNIRGYNPFEKRLGDGVLRVMVPKTGNAAEITRDYAVTFNAAGLADLGCQIQAALGIPEEVEPVCKLVKLHFRQ